MGVYSLVEVSDATVTDMHVSRTNNDDDDDDRHSNIMPTSA